MYRFQFWYVISSVAQKILYTESVIRVTKLMFLSSSNIPISLHNFIRPIVAQYNITIDITTVQNIIIALANFSLLIFIFMVDRQD